MVIYRFAPTNVPAEGTLVLGFTPHDLAQLTQDQQIDLDLVTGKVAGGTTRVLIIFGTCLQSIVQQAEKILGIKASGLAKTVAFDAEGGIVADLGTTIQKTKRPPHDPNLN